MKPILFSAPMVQAILAGNKTQTRRVCNPQPEHHYDGMACVGNDCEGDRCEHCDRGVPCPGREHSRWYDAGGNNWACSMCGGEIAPFTGNSRIHAKHEKGDILWVRETWCKSYGSSDENDFLYHYKADDPHFKPADHIVGGQWKPPIHMPQAAARIFLKVTDVRCERLQDISPEDAHDEGIAFRPFDSSFPDYRAWLIRDYRELWDSIHTKRRYDGDCVAKKRGHNWDANPWVWAYVFERTWIK